MEEIVHGAAILGVKEFLKGKPASERNAWRVGLRERGENVELTLSHPELDAGQHARLVHQIEDHLKTKTTSIPIRIGAETGKPVGAKIPKLMAFYMAFEAKHGGLESALAKRALDVHHENGRTTIVFKPTERSTDEMVRLVADAYAHEGERNESDIPLWQSMADAAPNLGEKPKGGIESMQLPGLKAPDRVEELPRAAEKTRAKPEDSLGVRIFSALGKVPGIRIQRNG